MTQQEWTKEYRYEVWVILEHSPDDGWQTVYKTDSQEGAAAWMHTMRDNPNIREFKLQDWYTRNS